MSDNAPDLKEILSQARDLQAKLKKVQEEAGAKTVRAESGAGMVAVVANLRGEIVEVKIVKSLFETDDLSMLQDLVRAAVNEALRQAREGMQHEISDAAGGIILPNVKLF